MRVIYGSPLSGKTKELIKEANLCNPTEILFFTTEIPEGILKVERDLNHSIKVIQLNSIEHLSILKIIQNYQQSTNVVIKHIFVDQLLSAQYRPKNLNILKFNEILRIRLNLNIKVTFTCDIKCDLLSYFKNAGEFETTFINLDNNKKLEDEYVENKIKKLESQKQEIDVEINKLVHESFTNRIRKLQIDILNALTDFQLKYDKVELSRVWDCKNLHYFINYEPLANNYRVLWQKLSFSPTEVYFSSEEIAQRALTMLKNKGLI